MRRFTFAMIFALLLGGVATSPAQEEEDIVSATAWINEYTEGADMLSYAAREAVKGNYKAAIEVYQGLIEKVRTEEDFASRVVASEEGVFLPLRKRCYKDILKLPPQGREVYGILYDAKSDRMYEQAASARDMESLVVVAQDFLLTPAGRSACVMLADLCIEKAEYSLALHYLDTLVNYHYRDSNEPALCALKRAACLLQSGEKTAARSIVARLQSTDALTDSEKQICECLLEYCAATTVVKKTVFNSYYDGFVDIQNPPSAKLVEKPLEGMPDPLDWRFRLERKTMEQPNRGYANYGLTAQGSYGYDLYPVFYNDLVFVNDSSRVYSLAADGGKIKWREPDEDTSKIEGLPLGCYIADGRLYAVLRNTNTYRQGRTIRGKAPAIQAVNELYCFDADRLGENPPLWHTGSLREMTKLGETSFTSVPYVDGSRIYVAGVEITEQDQNYSVCCFSAEGSLLWQTQFCATKWTNQQALLRAASLTITRGRVIACTNVGIAASLSVFTGELEWIYRYPQIAAPDSGGGQVLVPQVTWQALPPIAWYGTHPADGKPCEALVLAPGDSEFILGFDMAARRLLWRWERKNHTFLIGPRGEDIFVYGGSSLESSDPVVRQHRIPDGLIRWEATIPADAFDEQDSLFGKGIATPHALYIPCSRQLLEIVDGKDERAYFGKVSSAGTWYKIGGEEEKPEPTEEDSEQERLRRMLAARGLVYPGQQQRQQIDETRLHGNILLLPGRIISSGYLWTNSFRERKGSDK